jgi:predicted nucleic-acid-binding protein
MIALDTNILARYLVADDRAQAKSAEKLFLSKNDFWVPVTVWLELSWVLKVYGCDAKEIASGVRHVLSLSGFEASATSELLRALEWYESGADFGDAIHLSQSLDAEEFVTFDQALAKQSSKLTASPRVRCLK